mgnify:CR=1 FL=1
MRGHDLGCVLKPCAVTFSDNAARAWVRNTVVDHHGTGAMFIGIYRSELGNLTLVYNTDDDIEVVYTIWKL